MTKSGAQVSSAESGVYDLAGWMDVATRGVHRLTLGRAFETPGASERIGADAGRLPARNGRGSKVVALR